MSAITDKLEALNSRLLQVQANSNLIMQWFTDVQTFANVNPLPVIIKLLFDKYEKQITWNLVNYKVVPLMLIDPNPVIGNIYFQKTGPGQGTGARFMILDSATTVKQLNFNDTTLSRLKDARQTFNIFLNELGVLIEHMVKSQDK